ncbi:hypothetical protein [Microterricola viridarii]|uniref:SipW-cognate class signal peptide n=1 Tax=Microterricola viridarii TaxID=412690 RepID=A0A0X8E477_9MICO|nr:hypothetical protein [Microterricola viridarii]AMB59407.1 hypothetical protein AWU67_11655 [Microterricola viridarii]
MNKRTLAALGAIFGSVLLVLGVQQAFVATTAAWTDQVNFTAPVSSGTWTTPQAQIKLDTKGVVVGAGPVLTVQLQVQNVKPASGAGGPVNTLSTKITFPTAALGTAPQIAPPTGWTLYGSPVTSGTNQTFEYRRTITVPLYGDTGTIQFKFPLACNKGNKFMVSTLIESPEATNSLTFSEEAHILGWTC